MGRLGTGAALLVGSGAKDYHITRASPPTVALSYGGQVLKGIISESRGSIFESSSIISTHCKRVFRCEIVCRGLSFPLEVQCPQTDSYLE